MSSSSTHADAAELEARAAVRRVRQALSSVESAALAGLAAAVLLTLSAYLLAQQPGVASPSSDLAWYHDPDHQLLARVGLNFAPLGVIAFLWFMEVIRRRLGDREDRFFATVFLCSGLAFGLLTMIAAVAAAVPTLVVRYGNQSTPDQTTVSVAHAMWFGLWGICASRLVGVFMVATSTVGARFGAFPRWLSSLGLLLGAVLGITGAFIGPLDFLFPIWLVVVSITLLLTRRDRERQVAAPT